MSDGYIVLNSNPNAPNTTIAVHGLTLTAMFDTGSGFVNLNVKITDVSGNPINMPRQVRRMTSAELSAVMNLPMTDGETIWCFVYRAAAPYISSAYGITYTIHHG